MAWEFHVGQRVQCINDEAMPGFNSIELKKGETYVVRSIEPHTWRDPDTGAVLSGMGIHVHGLRCFGQAPFAARRFRPLRERKTSIECFRALLNPTDKKVDA